MKITKVVRSTKDLKPNVLGETIYSVQELITTLQHNKLYSPAESHGVWGQPLGLYDLYNALIATTKSINDEERPEIIITEKLYDAIQNNYDDDDYKFEINGLNLQVFWACLLYIRMIDYGMADLCVQEMIEHNKDFLKRKICIDDGKAINDNVEITINQEYITVHDYIRKLVVKHRDIQQNDNSSVTDKNGEVNNSSAFSQEVHEKDMLLIETLRKELSEKDSTINTLQNNLNEANQNIDELKGEIEEMQEEIDPLYEATLRVRTDFLLQAFGIEDWDCVPNRTKLAELIGIILNEKPETVRSTKNKKYEGKPLKLNEKDHGKDIHNINKKIDECKYPILEKYKIKL